MIETERYIHVLLFTVFSLLCCLLAVIVKNNYRNKNVKNIRTYAKESPQRRGVPLKPGRVSKLAINVSLKSMVYDYVTGDFFQNAAIAILLFIVVFVEIMKVKNVPRVQDVPPLFFAVPTTVLSFGFTGIIESAPHINWRYNAIVFPQSFLYFFKRTAIFLLCVFGPFLAALMILVLRFGVLPALMNLYYTAVLLFFSVGVAFVPGNVILKSLVFIIAIILTMRIGFVRAYLLPLLLLPVLLSLVKANNEYKEWYIL